MTNESRGFERFTRISEAREQLLSAVTPIERTERTDLATADGRVVSTTIKADRAVPHYERAAMDGYAVRATETFDASDRSPITLQVADKITSGTAVRVHTGSELPDTATAVVKIEATERNGSEVRVFQAVAEGENVAPVGEDVQLEERLFESGHRLRPSDIGLLKAVGVDSVPVYERPRVSVIPTGDELVQRDPEPGEIIETNGQTVAQYVKRWGGDASYRGVVPDARDALREAIEGDCDHDMIVTTGGSSVGERDLVPEIVDDLGDVFSHGVALKPGHPVALGRIKDTPVVMLPGYPVACIVNAVQFLRPALERIGQMPHSTPQTTAAILTRKITSEPGIRTFARVTVEETDKRVAATPTRTSGAGVLSSVTLADGWVVVPEAVEGYPSGEEVAVETWEGFA